VLELKRADAQVSGCQNQSALTDKEVYFYCMDVVVNTVLVFGSTKSNELTGDGSEFPLVVALGKSDMSFKHGFSLQAVNTIKYLEKCTASYAWQVGIDTEYSAFMVSQDLLSDSPPDYEYYRALYNFKSQIQYGRAAKTHRKYALHGWYCTFTILTISFALQIDLSTKTTVVAH